MRMRSVCLMDTPCAELRRHANAPTPGATPDVKVLHLSLPALVAAQTAISYRHADQAAAGARTRSLGQSLIYSSLAGLELLPNPSGCRTDSP